MIHFIVYYILILGMGCDHSPKGDQGGEGLKKSH